MTCNDTNKYFVVLYGKPGVGKLTIALELQKLLDAALMHNHLTSDLVYSVFDRSNPQGSLLKQRIRVEVLRTWKEHGDKSIIITQIYKAGKNEHYFEEMTAAIAGKRFLPVYIHLWCRDEVLKKRVESESRGRFGKITKWDQAQKKMERERMSEDLPFPNNFRIDTSELSPTETAQKVSELVCGVNHHQA